MDKQFACTKIPGTVTHYVTILWRGSSPYLTNCGRRQTPNESIARSMQNIHPRDRLVALAVCPSMLISLGDNLHVLEIQLPRGGHFLEKKNNIKFSNAAYRNTSLEWCSQHTNSTEVLEEQRLPSRSNPREVSIKRAQ